MQPITTIIVAILVIALVLALGVLWLLRGSKKKGVEVGGGAGAAADWQRQAQQAWSQPAGSGATGAGWGQPQQQAPGWGGGPAGAAGGAWGSQAQGTAGAGSQNLPQQAAWNPQSQPAGAWNPPQEAAPASQSPGSWGMAGQGASDPSRSWNPSSPATPSSPQQAAWNMPNQSAPVQSAPQAPSWGTPPSSPSPDAWHSAQSAGQQSWGAQQSGAGLASGAGWGTPPATPQAQPQAAFGGGSAGQSWNPPMPQTSDPWAANQSNPAQAQFQGMSPAPAAAALPSWQQQGGAGIQQDQNAAFFGADSDRTMLRSGPASALPQSTVGIVRVEEGKEPGRIYEIRKETLSIGRSRESDIFLEDLAVSRLHASILNMGNGNYALKDEGSANGTKINNQLVNKYQTYPLQDGDRIQLGQTVLVFGRR